MEHVDSVAEFSHTHYSRDDDLISLQVEPHRSVAVSLVCSIVTISLSCRSLRSDVKLQVTSSHSAVMCVTCCGAALQELSRKYMRCSSRVTVYHLKRFLLQKLSVPPLYDVCMSCTLLSHDCTVLSCDLAAGPVLW